MPEVDCYTALILCMSTVKITICCKVFRRHLEACTGAGLGHVNKDDIADSRKFMRKVFREKLQESESSGRALVAAGACI